MKVIQELITYLEQRGKLKPRQIEQLVAKGYAHQYQPADLRSLESRHGETFFFQVTGNVQGPLWGTDTYTSDSNLGTACVHAGLLKTGEFGVVKVTIVKPPPNFQGTTRHGVSSSPYGQWPGAYEIELFTK
jgi:hypothetical protein